MTFFIIISLLAITSGGVITAFTAKKPNRIANWASAYLILVVGVIQLGLIVAWQEIGSPSQAVAITALNTYNLGNLSVLFGTIYKTKLKNYSLLVNLGGLLLAIAMILLILTPSYANFSWILAGFLALVITILISMPIGLIMSNRRKPSSS